MFKITVYIFKITLILGKACFSPAFFALIGSCHLHLWVT